jgi:hypothetical protein
MDDDSYRIWKKAVGGEWLFWDVCDSGDVLINLYSTYPDMCRGEAPESVACVTSKGASGFRICRGGKSEVYIFGTDSSVLLLCGEEDLW